MGIPGGRNRYIAKSRVIVAQSLDPWGRPRGIGRIAYHAGTPRAPVPDIERGRRD